MKKLTAEKCGELIKQLKSCKEFFGPLSIKEEYKLQSLEIALPVLKQQEKASGKHQEGE